MKLAIIAVCLLGFMLLECHSSPVQLVENHELVAKARALAGRQAATGDVAPAAPAAAVAAAAADEDDDDEDDDDDEPDLGDLVDDDDDDDDEEDDDDDDGDEDDDDDDEEDKPQGQAAPGAAASDDDEEDDDDDDYLDRIFDDILGDDDDDDDDDEDDTPAAAVAAQPTPVAAAAQPAPAAAISPAQTAAVAEVLEEAASSAVDAENAIAPAADDAAEGEQNVFYDEENTGIDTKVDIQSLNNKPLESTTAKAAVVAAPAAAAAAANEVESSDDDDDDDEDDITGALTGDDDDEDDDDTDDAEDDDDDDIVGDDVIEARRARGAEKTVIIEMPKDAFQDRHNQFIDAIFARINSIVSDSYDPFKVRLATAPKQAATKTKQATTKATKTNKKSKTKKVAAGSKARSTDTTDNTVPDVKSTAAIEQNPTPASSAEEIKRQQPQPKPETTVTESAEKRTVPSLSATKNRKKTQPLRSTSANTNSNANRQATKQKLKQTAPSNSVSSGPVVAKLRRAEGTLSGLASLRRVGNAKVVSDPEGRNSTIKSKFTLGPLTLKVEKSFKRGNVRNVKTATARTNEMIGRIKFSVVNDKATLVSIKVQQPKQVEIESKDNHDRTREFVWRRTPKIARLVSEKLKLAAESLFRPTAGVEVVRL